MDGRAAHALGEPEKRAVSNPIEDARVTGVRVSQEGHATSSGEAENGAGGELQIDEEEGCGMNDGTNDQSCFLLTELPAIAFRHVLSFLGPGDLLRLACVSRELFELIRRDDTLWVGHLEEYAFGRWDELCRDMSKLTDDAHISDWFAYNFRRLRSVRHHSPVPEILQLPANTPDMSTTKTSTSHSTDGTAGAVLRPSTTPDETLSGGEVVVDRSDESRRDSSVCECWNRIRDPILAIETDILRESYELFEDGNCPIGVLMRKFVYDLGLYKRQVALINFRESLNSDVVALLEQFGQARDRDLLRRKHRHLRSTYVRLHEPTTSLSTCDNASPLKQHFPILNGIPLAPLLICEASQVKSTSCFSVCGPRGLRDLLLQLHAEAQLDTYFRGNQTSTRNDRCGEGPRSTLRRFCDEMERFDMTVDFKRFGDILQSLQNANRCNSTNNMDDDDNNNSNDDNNNSSHYPSFRIEDDNPPFPKTTAELVRLYPFGQTRNRAWRRKWRRWLLQDPTCDRFIAIARWKIRERINRIIESALYPLSSGCCQRDIVRLDLTDAEELGGNNAKQEMVSCALISPSAVLLVMQLIGKGRL